MEDLSAISTKLLALDGFSAAGLIDPDGACLDAVGSSRQKIEASALQCATFWKAKQEVLEVMHITEKVEDVLLLIDGYCQILRPWKPGSALFLYVLFERSSTSPAMLRRALANLF